LKYEDCLDVDLCRVNFVEAINDSTYYLNALAAVEKNFQDRIAQRRIDEAVGVEPPTTTSSKNYIYQNIIPALLPALEVVARDRPDDPLELMAFYMLRHKMQYNNEITVVQPTDQIPVETA